MEELLAPTQGQSGTTLTQTISAAAVWNNTINWNISKSSDTSSLNLFRGDTGTVQYTISVTNDTGASSVSIVGQVYITNGGDIATIGLMSVLQVFSPANGALITTTTLDVSMRPVPQPGEETFCYPYIITLPNFQPNQTVPQPFKITANTTILNHSGHIDTPFGPSTSVS